MVLFDTVALIMTVVARKASTQTGRTSRQRLSDAITVKITPDFNVMHVVGRAVLILMACCLLGGPSAMAAQNRNVLVIFSNNRLLPANLEIDRGMRETIVSPADRKVELAAEFLDYPAFAGQLYEKTFVTYLREKYAARTPHILVIAGKFAFEFLHRHRTGLFPEIPALFIAVDKSVVETHQPLTVNTIGIPVEYDFAGTVQQALRWHPHARRLMVVTGASPHDREFEAFTRAGLARINVIPKIEFMTGLPTAAVLKKLSGLGTGDVVFTPGYFRDGAGRAFSPRESVILMTAASRAPVYGPYDTFIGTGIVGGRMPTFVDIGRQGGNIINRLLDGVSPAALNLPESVPTQVQIDWRQARKWNINPEDIPSDAVIHFKEPTFWEVHRSTVIIVVAVILLQAGLIAGLLIQRSRRARAEASQRRSEDSLRKLTDRLIHLQEEDRQRIAAELHDGLGQSLAIIRNRATICLRSADDADRVAEQLEEISSTAAAAINEVREIAHNLRPYELDRLGLIHAIESMIEKVSESLPLHLSARLDNVDGLLPADAETGIYRIVQEGLNNVIKHANATEARVTVMRLGKELVVTVEDNGAGMKAGSNGVVRGFGLAGIRQRAHMLGGACTMDSRPGRTVLAVRLPLSGEVDA
jgi:signal transduction histidine kinase